MEQGFVFWKVAVIVLRRGLRYTSHFSLVAFSYERAEFKPVNMKLSATLRCVVAFWKTRRKGNINIYFLFLSVRCVIMMLCDDECEGKQLWEDNNRKCLSQRAGPRASCTDQKFQTHLQINQVLNPNCSACLVQAPSCLRAQWDPPVKFSAVLTDYNDRLNFVSEPLMSYMQRKQHRNNRKRQIGMVIALMTQKRRKNAKNMCVVKSYASMPACLCSR